MTFGVTSQQTEGSFVDKDTHADDKRAKTQAGHKIPAADPHRVFLPVVQLLPAAKELLLRRGECPFRRLRRISLRHDEFEWWRIMMTSPILHMMIRWTRKSWWQLAVRENTSCDWLVRRVKPMVGNMTSSAPFWYVKNATFLNTALLQWRRPRNCQCSHIRRRHISQWRMEKMTEIGCN